jgi:hypothetical protein
MFDEFKPQFTTEGVAEAIAEALEGEGLIAEYYYDQGQYISPWVRLGDGWHIKITSGPVDQDEQG